MIDFLGVPLSLVNVTGWGAFSLLSWILVRSFLSGRIRTEREVLELRTESSKWQEAWQERGVVILELLSQNAKLLGAQELTNKVVQSVREGTDVGGDKEAGRAPL